MLPSCDILHIVDEHAQKHMSPNTVFDAMTNGAYHEIYGLERTKRSFDLAE